jgi:effector-binding domain-containing protein
MIPYSGTTFASRRDQDGRAAACLEKFDMIGTPIIEERPERPYMGIRTQATMKEFKRAIPQLLGEVIAWLKHEGVPWAGAPLIRYYVIDMKSKLEIELGVPVAVALTGDDRVKPAVLPAGRYAALVYTGVKNGVKANGALLDWGAEQGLVWDKWETTAGDAFGSRYESFLTDPAEEPNQAKWETEVAIRLAA